MLSTMQRTQSFSLLCLLVVLFSGCSAESGAKQITLSEEIYFDKAYGAWQAIMVANHTGLLHEGKYLDQPSTASEIELALLDEWSTDDDTAIEWVDIHIMETYGLDPTYTQIRDEWIDHLNHDIWVSTLRARELMEEGFLPPETGGAALNPDGVWSIDAQLETELFGLIAPGMAEEAMKRARYFARVTNSGLAVDVSAFYAALYADAYFESDVQALIRRTRDRFPAEHEVRQIAETVLNCHVDQPADWRFCRQVLAEQYDTDPEWWAAKINFASTIMALLYGDGDIIDTLTIAALAGWDADNNMTTSAGLLGIISGHAALPPEIRDSSDVYFNEDVTGPLPRSESVASIARRTQRLAEALIRQSGGETGDDLYRIAAEAAHPDSTSPTTSINRSSPSMETNMSVQSQELVPSNLSQYRWQNRLLLIFAPTHDDPSMQQQVEWFSSQVEAFEERDLLIFNLFEDSGENVIQLRDQYSIQPGSFAVLLVGKDGGLKNQFDRPVRPEEIFALIDVMPMRMQEMQQGE